MMKSRNTIYIVLFFALILSLWIGMSLLAKPSAVELPAGARVL